MSGQFGHPVKYCGCNTPIEKLKREKINKKIFRKMAMNSMNAQFNHFVPIKKSIIEFIVILLIINVNSISLLAGHPNTDPQQNHHICDHKHPKAHDVSFEIEICIFAIRFRVPVKFPCLLLQAKTFHNSFQPSRSEREKKKSKSNFFYILFDL